MNENNFRSRNPKITETKISNEQIAKEKFEKGVSFYEELNYKNSFDSFMEAANLNHLEAQYNIGCFYEFGVGVEKSFKNAVHWYTIASTNGYQKADKRIKIVVDKMNSKLYMLGFGGN